MMRRKHLGRKPLYWWLFLVGLHLAGLLLYVLYIRSLITAAYQGEAPDWFTQLIKGLYPRFFTEQHRFPMAFFLEKADQILLRYLLFISMAGGVYYFYTSYQQPWRKLTQPQITPQQAYWLRIAWVVISLWAAYDWQGILLNMHRAAAFYAPISFYRLYPVFPSKILIQLCWWGWLVATLLSLTRWKTTLWTSLSVGLFIIQQGWLWGFHKMDHTWASLNYMSLWMPLLVVQQQQAQRKEKTFFPASALFLIQVSIAFVYLQAGLEKLLVGGWGWLEGATFRTFLLSAQTDMGRWVAQHDFLCQLLPVLGIIFELGFLAVFISKFWRIIWLIAGILFHLGTFLLLGAGWYITPWTLLYIFYIFPQKNSHLAKPV